MKWWTIVLTAGLALSMPLAPECGQKDDVLTDWEADKLREAQEPSERIKVYLELAQSRIDLFEQFRKKPEDPRYDNARYLVETLEHHIAILEELKNWIEYQYAQKGDMRKGLRALLEQGPRQLEQIRGIKQSPDAYTSAYQSTLRDAIEDWNDMLDGATRALATQEKQFAEMKQAEKEAVRLDKQRRKEEERRTKEEKKLRKRLGKRGVPAEGEDD